jgi:hypothetical protein
MVAIDTRLELTSEALRQYLRAAVSGIVPCPTGSDFYTDISIDDVTPIRGDDLDNLFPGGLQAAWQAVDPTISIPTLDTIDVQTATGTAQQSIAAIYLLVSGSARFLSQAQLDQERTSDPPTDPFLTTFTRFVDGSGALLFHIDQSKTTIDPRNGATLHLEFVAVANVAAPSLQAPRSLVTRLRALLGDVPIQIPALALPAPFSTGGLVNAAVTCEPWGDDKTGKPLRQQHGPHGVRAGIDLAAPADTTAWQRFDDPTTELWSPPQQFKDWGLFLSGDVLQRMLVGVLEPQIPKNDPTYSFDKPSSSWNGSTVEVRVGVNKSAETVPHLGDIVVDLSFSGDTTDPTILVVTLHIRFDEDVAAAIGRVIVDGIIGAVIAGAINPFFAIAGAVIGIVVAIVDDSLIASGGTAKSSALLGGATLPSQCTNTDPQTRTCRVPIQVPIPGIGDLDLSKVIGTSDGLFLIGFAVPNSSTPLAIGHVDVKQGPWNYPWGPCSPPDPNPIKAVVLTNTGQLPLEICDVAERTIGGRKGAGGPRQGAKLLDLFFGYPPIVVQPGQSYSLSVKARIGGRSDYNSKLPLLVRVITSGGDLEIDLNQPLPAALEDAAVNARFAFISQVLCDANIFPPVVQWQMPYIDPVPFRSADVVLERLVLQFAAADGARVLGLARGGTQLVEAFAGGGGVLLSMSHARAGASSHAVSDLAVEHANTAKGATSVLNRATTPAHAFSRIVYRRTASYPLRSPLIGATRAGRLLALLTARELRIVEVRPGALTSLVRVPVSSGVAVACIDDTFFLAADGDLVRLRSDGSEIWRRSRAILALAALDGRLWIGDSAGISEMQIEGTSLCERSRVALAGVQDLAAADGAVVARRADEAWIAGPSVPRRLDAPCVRLGSVAGLPAVVGPASTVVFDREGRRRMVFGAPPWESTIVEWAEVAVELLREGTAVLYDRFEPAIDADHLPAEVRRLSQ